MVSKYRIVPKRDFQGKGFYCKGKWIRHGFVVTDGFCNIMPGATWFESIRDALIGVECYKESGGDANKFWALVRRGLNYGS